MDSEQCDFQFDFPITYLLSITRDLNKISVINLNILYQLCLTFYQF